MCVALVRGLFSAFALSSAALAQCGGWEPVYSTNGLNERVSALRTYDDGSGPALYAGGLFTVAGGASANHIAKWNGTSWSTLGSGLTSGTPVALQVFDDGSGTALFAAGSFMIAGGSAANRIAKWNGSQWSPLGSGMNGSVFALAVFDDGSGPALYAGGEFTLAGGITAWRIAKWNGASWSTLGSGVDDYVKCLCVFDDGSGPALYAGGNFTVAGGTSAKFIAKWNGTSWSGVGGGVSEGLVYALERYDDGSGPALYAGGNFTIAGGNPANYVAKWNGASWSALGDGVDSIVVVLRAFDFGSGPGLYAGGIFGVAGGVSANYVARWSGTSWSGLDVGLDYNGYALEAFDDGMDADADLFVGGFFTHAGGATSTYIAKWNGCGTSSFCFGDGSSGACPCANNGFAGQGCNNSSNTGGALLAVSGVASLAFDTVLFNASGEKPTALSILAQGQTEIAAVPFGQGLRCVTGNLKRMYSKNAVGGAFSAPTGAEPSVHVRSATLGDVIPPGSSRYYYAYYRDATVLGGCTSASTFNATQSVRLIWSP